MAVVYIPGWHDPVTTQTIAYTYDPLYRLTAADYSNGDYYHYTLRQAQGGAYDAVGNRLTQQKSIIGLVTTDTYTYDDANRLSSMNAVNYAWDNNGNLLNDGVNTYTYDAANRLKTLTGPSVNASYAYNGMGDRLQQVHNGGTTNFMMDYNTGLTQVLNDGTNNYIYGNGRIAQVNTGTDYFLGDALGSVRQLTNTSGAITYASAYDPYGVTTQTHGAAQTAYGFTGEYTSNDLVYLRARYYVPGMGRFLTRDTWGGDDRIPLSFNGWNYTYSNPINYSDPSGYCTGYKGLDAPLKTLTHFATPSSLLDWKSTKEAWKYAWDTCIDSLKKADAAFRRGDFVRGYLYGAGYAASSHQAAERIGQINSEFDILDCPNASWQEKFYAGADIGLWGLNVASFITPFAYEGWLAAKGALGDSLFGSFGRFGVPDEFMSPMQTGQWRNWDLPEGIKTAEDAYRWGNLQKYGLWGPNRRLDSIPGPMLPNDALVTLPGGDLNSLPLGSPRDPSTTLLWTANNRGANFIPEQTAWPTSRFSKINPDTTIISHTNISRGAYVGGEAWYTGPNQITIAPFSGAYGSNPNTLSSAQFLEASARFEAAVDFLRALGIEVIVIP